MGWLLPSRTETIHSSLTSLFRPPIISPMRWIQTPPRKQSSNDISPPGRNPRNDYPGIIRGTALQFHLTGTIPKNIILIVYGDYSLIMTSFETRPAHTHLTGLSRYLIIWVYHVFEYRV